MNEKTEFFTQAKKPVFSAIVFVFTTVVTSVGYAAWTTLDRNLAASGQTLSSTLMQAVIDDVNDANTRLSNFSFSSGNVGIWIATPGAKLEVNGVIARTGCPTGMVSGWPYCIDSAQRAAATWNAATDACFAENKRLCTTDEWSSACRRSVFSRSTAWNWTGQSYALQWSGTYYYYAATVVWYNDCNHVSWDNNNTTAAYGYRCCTNRVLGGN